MTLNFVDDVAIVTGAGCGIGHAICQHLATSGCAVVLNDVDPELVESAAAKIRGLGHRCVGVAGDASDPALIQKLVDTAVNQFGALTIAVANAGITLFGDFFDFKPEAFDRVMQVNLRGSFFLAQSASIQMRRQGRGGRILFMSSVTGHQAHKNLAAYAMTKAGVQMLARNLVIELAPYGITTNAIAPGATATERTTSDADYEPTWARITPTGRPGRVGDVAATALFLLSKEAAHITGQTIVVDGGWSCISPSPF